MSEPAKADWHTDESLPHRGEYVVIEDGWIVAQCGPFQRGWENAERIALALNRRVSEETTNDG